MYMYIYVYIIYTHAYECVRQMDRRTKIREAPERLPRRSKRLFNRPEVAPNQVYRRFKTPTVQSVSETPQQISTRSSQKSPKGHPPTFQDGPRVPSPSQDGPSDSQNG